MSYLEIQLISADPISGFQTKKKIASRFYQMQDAVIQIVHYIIVKIEDRIIWTGELVCYQRRERALLFTVCLSEVSIQPRPVYRAFLEGHKGALHSRELRMRIDYYHHA